MRANAAKILTHLSPMGVSASSPVAWSARQLVQNQDLAVGCFKIRGRVRIVSGAGTVIWRIGTDRLLRAEDEDITIPDNLARAVTKRGDVYGRGMLGDFEVGPLTKSTEGEMQTVCMRSARELVVKENIH